MTQRFMLLALAIMAGMSFYGCTQDCVYPDVQTFSLRLVNSMPDQPRITVFINGKVFKRNYSYAPPPDFGYTSTYEDGTQLPVGTLSLAVTSDEAGMDTLHKGFITPNLNRQTLVIAGRGKKLLATDTSNTAHILLDDQDVAQSQEAVQIRVAHAIGDLPPIDVYFRVLPTDGTPLPQPDLTLAYRQVSPRITLDSLPGLTVTVSGQPGNVIFSTPTPFAAKGFLVTAIIRGSAEPCGSEPVAAPLVLTDVEGGKVVVDLSVWGARFVNATKSTTLSLTATNAPPQPHIPRTNLPGQAGKVLNIAPDVVTDYFGAGTVFFGSTRWFFSRDLTMMFDTVFGIHHKAVTNDRWTFIAFEDPSDVADGIGGIVIKDTMACVPEAFGKARVVNLSPEAGPVTVKVGTAPSIPIAQGQLALTTQAAGSVQVTITNGTLTQTHTVNLPPARPISIYILPSKPGQSFPIMIGED